jgi:hypothetical protein
MKRTNSMGKVFLYAILTAILFATANEIAWKLLGATVVLSIYIVMTVVSLAMIFTEKRA